MDRFKIIQADSVKYKRDILRSWDEYLPGTPSGRFEWMNEGNPAGPSIWFIAFDNKNDEVAGMISFMPRYLYLNGERIRSVIMGDFMIGRKYRAFGPNLQLPKTAIAHIKAAGYRLIYTIPNPASEKVMERVGFVKSAGFCQYVKPLKFIHYYNKKGGVLIAPLIDTLMKILSKETYVSNTAFFEEPKEIDNRFDLLWDNLRLNQPDKIIGDRSSLYLKWRYSKNPLYQFRILSLKKAENYDLAGFIIFTITQNKLFIYDMVALNEDCLCNLLKGIITIARKENCVSANIDILETNPMLKTIKPFRFFNAKGDYSIMSHSDMKDKFNNCLFFAGDRNT